MRDAHREAWTAFFEAREASPAPVRTKPATARGRLNTRGAMNKTEAAYESHLNLRKITGEVLWFAFECITFKLAGDCRYTADFAVMLTDLTLEMHEVKGAERRTKKSGERYTAARVEDDALVKISVAAAQIPIVFKIVYRVEGNWVERAF